MRQAILFLAPLLAACGGGGGNDSAGRVIAGGETAASDSRPEVQTADLTGLYEARAQGAKRSRMCMISEEPSSAAFGLVVETPGGSCGGAGEAVRTGNRLRLTMAGEGECAIEALLEGTQVTFPDSLPEGCAYYCGSGATLAGERFEKTGGTVEEAMRATDLAGDPLCG